MNVSKTIELNRRAKVLLNRRISNQDFQLVLQNMEIATSATPGQFVLIRISDTFDPLLRRPFSIMNTLPDSKFEIIYRIVGRGTQYLSQIPVGTYLDCLGPLGNGFTLPHRNTRVFLIGGGVGTPPLFFLAKRITDSHIRNQTVFIGSRTKDELLLVQAFSALGIPTHVATDDGSSGFHGTVIDAFLSALEQDNSGSPMAIYACGPKPMLDRVVLIAEARRIPTQISMENHMACGVGACLGCSVKTLRGVLSVCKDGPVFPADLFFYETSA